MHNDLSKNNKLVNANVGFNRGNMFENLFWPYKYISDYKPSNEKEELMYNIQKYCFASHEMNLYLDLYPNDLQAIGLYNQYKEQENKYLKDYEDKYGFITLNINNNNNWQWINSPWPWERN